MLRKRRARKSDRAVGRQKLSGIDFFRFTRPLREVGPLRCEATAIHVGSRVATAQGRIVDKTGRLYAHGTATCIVVEAGSAQRRRR